MTEKIYPTYEQAMFLKALIEMYQKHPVAIAELCDKHLCPSGSLLGVVENFAVLMKVKG